MKQRQFCEIYWNWKWSRCSLYKMSCLLNWTPVKFTPIEERSPEYQLKTAAKNFETIQFYQCEPFPQIQKFWLSQRRKTVIKEDWCLREKDLSEFDSESQSGTQTWTPCVKLVSGKHREQLVWMTFNNCWLFPKRVMRGWGKSPKLWAISEKVQKTLTSHVK